MNAGPKCAYIQMNQGDASIAAAVNPVFHRSGAMRARRLPPTHHAADRKIAIRTRATGPFVIVANAIRPYPHHSTRGRDVFAATSRQQTPPNRNAAKTMSNSPMLESAKAMGTVASMIAPHSPTSAPRRIAPAHRTIANNPRAPSALGSRSENSESPNRVIAVACSQ